MNCCGGGLNSPEAVSLKKWNSTINRIAKGLHSGKISASDLDPDFIAKTGATISEGITDGYAKVVYNETDINNIVRMQRNAYLFGGAKNAAFQNEMATFLVDDDGRTRSWADFKKDVLNLDSEYNQTYLQAEFQTAVRSSQAVKQWDDIQRRASRYPNLIYKTANDERVREEHQALNEKIRPVNHSFWDVYFPPNGWRCRCYVVQTDKEANGDEILLVHWDIKIERDK